MGSQSTTIANSYTYDHMGRKTETRQRTGAADAPEVLLSKLDYNDVGQLKSKEIGDGLQTLNYAYNERGWLRTMTSSSNLFFLDMRYNTPDSGTPQYNGNITQMQYLTTKVTQPGYKIFAYSYDKLNRLTQAASTQGALDEQITYDQMGNITKLVRGGTGGGTLNYPVYEGNQLKTVTGYSPRSYLYDLNGNARSDGMGKNITYNMLNLPRSVTSGTTTVATYMYDANGNKLKNTGTDGTWDYVNGIVYKNNAIDFVSTEEGRVKLIGGTWSYEYNLKDHLGNTRVSIDRYNNAPRVIQEDEYYSFGLRKPTGNYDYSNNNRYLYNGKEIQTDLANQYDYEARFYDPVIGRFTAIDPLAEVSRKYSPYVYTYNNPVRFTDPDGMWTKDKAGNFHTDDPDDIAELIQHQKSNEDPKERNGGLKAASKLDGGEDPVSKKTSGANEGGAVIKSYEPDFFDQWGDSDNMFAKASYSLVDGVYVFGQSFVYGPDSRHLNGESVSGNDRVDAFVSTSALVLPIKTPLLNLSRRLFNFNGGYGFKVGRFDLLYRNPSVNGGTILSYKSAAGAKFRLDYHSFGSSVKPVLHYHTNMLGTSISPHRSLNPFTFGKPIKL